MSTVVFVHAHPDDEALLTSGTMARLSANGHRVVLVMATDGAAGLVSQEVAAGGDVAATRRAELATSGRALGVRGFHQLGYSDSGLAGDAVVARGQQRFADVDVEQVAAELVAIFETESADVVVGYDKSGGYGHPDHIAVHHAVRRAAEIYTFAPLLEATLPREPMLRVVKLIYAQRWAVPALGGLDIETWRTAYTPRDRIDYRVDVRPNIVAKRASLAAHASQATADDGPRTLSALLKLPAPVFKWVLGREYFHKVLAGDGAQPGLLGELFGPRYEPRRRKTARN
ncbi:MAG: PIG-L family deacetylase [Candidatus Nanopelagicales bacterium]